MAGLAVSKLARDALAFDSDVCSSIQRNALPLTGSPVIVVGNRVRQHFYDFWLHIGVSETSELVLLFSGPGSLVRLWIGHMLA